MTTEDKLKNCILDKYGSIIDFCQVIGMPTSTISTIFKRGVMSSSTTTMLKICDGLGIDLKSLADGEIVYVEHDEKTIELSGYAKLLETSNKTLTLNGIGLTKEERKMLSYALRISFEQLRNSTDC